MACSYRHFLRDGADNLAHSCVGLKLLVSLDNFLKGQNRINEDLEITALELGQVLAQLVPQLALIVLVAAPQSASFHANPLVQQLRDVNLIGYTTAHQAQHADAPIASRNIQVLLKVTGADKVHDQVNTLAIRLLQDLLRPVLFLVIERRRGAQLVLDKLALVSRARRRKDLFGARQLGALNPRNRHPRSSRMPQDSLPLPADSAQHKVQRLRRRNPRLRHARRLLEAQVRRLVQQHLGRHGDVLGVGAAVGQAEDLVAYFEVAVVAFAETVDDAGELDAQSAGRLRRKRVMSLALDQVHAVEPEGFDFDEGLAGLSLREGRFGVDEEVVGGAFAVLYVCLVF